MKFFRSKWFWLTLLFVAVSFWAVIRFWEIERNSILQRNAVRDLEKHGIQPIYDYQRQGKSEQEANWWIPNWMLDRYGKDFFHSVVEVSYSWQDQPDFTLRPGKFPCIEVLKIEDNNVGPENSWASQLTSLKKLYVYPNALKEVKYFETVEFATKPRKDTLPWLIGNRKLEDLMVYSNYLEFLPLLKNLRSLRIETSNSDWTGISKLDGLTELEIQTDKKVDVESLAKLSNLKSLKICCQYFPDLSSLNNLPNLERIELIVHAGNLGSIKIPKTSNLKLKRVVLIGREIYDFENLSSFKNLEVLCCRENGKKYIDSPNPKDIGSLLSLQNIATIEFEYMNIVIPDGIQNQAPLKTLLFRNCSVSGLEQLEKVTSIESLRLEQCSCTGFYFDLRHIRNMKKLSHLSLDNTVCKNFGVIGQFPNLRSLSIVNCNQESCYDEILNLDLNLFWLDISGGFIEYLNCVRNSRNLQFLYFHENFDPYEILDSGVTEKYFGSHLHLKHLHLPRILLDDPKVLSRFQKLESLQVTAASLPKEISLKDFQKLKFLSLLKVTNPKHKRKLIDINILDGCDRLVWFGTNHPYIINEQKLTNFPKLKEVTTTRRILSEQLSEVFPDPYIWNEWGRTSRPSPLQDNRLIKNPGNTSSAQMLIQYWRKLK